MTEAFKMNLGTDIKGNLENGDIGLNALEWHMSFGAELPCSQAATMLNGPFGHSPIIVEKSYDNSSPTLLKLLIKNGVIEKGTVTIGNDDGSTTKMEIIDAAPVAISIGYDGKMIKEKVDFVVGNVRYSTLVTDNKGNEMKKNDFELYP
ncbi:MAG: type VI secretion system tube protein Hcp [Betaproteobacteria bacterium]|nr:type VI secretion system tube protein Hcp [Betaproteobacteria bacterium]